MHISKIDKLTILNISKFNFEFKGGIEKEAKEVSKQIGKIHLIDTICFGNKNKIEKINSNERLVELRSFRVFRKIDISFGLVKYLLININKYDVIWIHYPNILPVLVILLVKLKPKLIIHWHNDINVFPLLYRLFKPLERLLLMKSKIIITTSPSYYKYSNALIDFEDKIECIHLRIKSLRNDVVLPYNNGKVILTTIGRYTAYKGYELLVDEVLKNPQFNLNIVSSSNFPNKLLTKINSANNIKILKNLTDSEVIETLKKSTVYVMSSISRNEGYGIVLLEALRCGIPICVNRVEGTGSEFILNPGNNGEFFNINEASSLINSIELLTKEGNYEKYMTGAIEDFHNRFKLEGTANYLSLIQANFK